MIMRKDANIFKQVFAATSGTMLQWYDFSLFGYLAPVIAELYFPAQNTTLSILYTFSLFAVSFLLAPVGSIFFGYIGDNYGRKRALTLSVLFMAIPTAIIGVLPTYAQIGIIASVLLILCRLIQGFIASAEYTGSAIFMVEHAKHNKPFLLGSLVSSSYSIGLLIGSVAATAATMEFMPTYFWRLPFLLALAAGLLIFYIRKNIAETQEYIAFNQAEKKSRTWFWTALVNSPKSKVSDNHNVDWLVCGDYHIWNVCFQCDIFNSIYTFAIVYCNYHCFIVVAARCLSGTIDCIMG